MNSMLLFAVCLSLSMVSASNDEYRLRSDIARRYDDIRRDIVPSAGGPLEIKLGLELVKILNLDEHQGSISIYGWLQYSWKDNNLVWDPANYGGITSLRMPSDKIWRPDIYLYSSLTADSGQDNSVMAVVDNDGTVLFMPPGIKTNHCDSVEDDDGNDDADDDADDSHDDSDEHRHPEWVCEFKYGSWVYDGHIISLGLYENKTTVDTSSYKENTRYEIANTSAIVETKYYPCYAEPYPEIRFQLRIRRR